MVYNGKTNNVNNKRTVNFIIHLTGGKHEYSKKEILTISVTGGRFPRVVRVPPHRKLLRGHTWTHFARWSRRPSLQSNDCNS